MILLEAGLLRSVQEVYDTNIGEIRKNKLKILLEDFVHEYRSLPQLCEIVSSCLEIREEQRPDFAELKTSHFPMAKIYDVPKDHHMNYMEWKSNDRGFEENYDHDDVMHVVNRGPNPY